MVKRKVVKKSVKKVVKKPVKKISKTSKTDVPFKKKTLGKKRIVNKNTVLNKKMKVLVGNLLSFFLFFLVTFILSYVFRTDDLSNLLFSLAALISGAVVVALVLILIAFKIFKNIK